MYGKIYNLHSSPALAPAEALLVSSSPAFDGLHDDIIFFTLACFYWKLLKKRRSHGECEPIIVIHQKLIRRIKILRLEYLRRVGYARLYLFLHNR